MDPATFDMILAQDGDEAAFSRVVAATTADVRRFCEWFCAPGADLDDVVQETYLRAFRGLGTFRAEASVVSWLMSIARRVCTEYVGARVRRRSVVDALRVEEDRHVEPADTSAIVLAVRELHEPFREAFVLVRVLGYSYDESAAILGCPRGTVQSRVARARALLAARLAGAGVSEAS